MRRGLLALVILFFPIMIFAATPTWEIVPDESKITFTGLQNNSPITGEFKKFNGEIKGDTDQLAKSSVAITIDTNSLSVSYKDLEDALKTADWFNVKLFPKAIFKAKKFKKTGENTFEAAGTLTILDKTLPLTVTLKLENYSKTKVRVSGSTLIKRTAFGVGKGEWGSTDEINDEVKVNFVMSAVRK